MSHATLGPYTAYSVSNWSKFLLTLARTLWLPGVGSVLLEATQASTLSVILDDVVDRDALRLHPASPA